MSFPIDLGAPSLTIGGLMQRQRGPRMPTMPGEVGRIPEHVLTQTPPSTARGHGIAEALANPASVESGHWGEAVAEALASGIRGRTARSEREREESLMARELARQESGDARDAELQQAQIARLRAQALAEEQPEPPDWQLDPVTGQPFAINPQGQVQYGEGRVNVRPQGAPSVRAPPAGYRYTPDGNMEAVPGGPADVRAGESAQRMARFYDTAIRNRENVLRSITNARGMANGWTTGLAGQVFSGVGGTPAHDLQSEVDTIIANIGFEALQEMRANSQTGGALGQVAVRELEMLQSTIASLRTSQSREQFLRNLERVEGQYRRTLQAYEAARGELNMGGTTQQAPAGQGDIPVIELD